jgi:hypothetical protein
LNAVLNGFTSEFLTRVGYGQNTPLGIYLLNTVAPKFTNSLARYNDWANPATRTQNDIIALNNAEAEALPCYEEVVGLLQSNPLVTDEELNTMLIPPRGRKSPHHSEPTHERVSVRIDNTVTQEVTVYFGSDKHPHGGKADFQHGVEVISAINDHQVVMQLDDLGNSVFATRSPYTFKFKSTDRGRYFYFAIRWENNIAQKGPWSEVFCVIIP